MRGNYILEPVYSKIERFGDVYRVRIKGLYGYYSRSGESMIPMQYTWLGEWGEQKIAYLKNHKYGFLNENQRVRIPAQYSKADKFSEGIAAVRIDKSWGYIDAHGDSLIEANFAIADAFHSGLARVAVGPHKNPDQQSWGLINTTGQYKVPLHYTHISPLQSGWYQLQDSLGSYFFDQYGIPMFQKPLEEAEAFSSGFGLGKINGEWFLLNREGNPVISSAKKTIFTPSEGVSIVQSSISFGLINKDGTTFLEPGYESIPLSPRRRFSA